MLKIESGSELVIDGGTDTKRKFLNGRYTIIPTLFMAGYKNLADSVS